MVTEKQLRKYRRDAEKLESYSTQWPKRIPLGEEAIKVMDSFGMGMRLAVPRNGEGDCKVIPTPHWGDFEEFVVSRETVDELLSSGLLGELTEERVNDKLGWRECGLPGDKYHLYACIQ